MSTLSLLFEICPFAFLIEKAGGMASDGQNLILDIPIKDYKQKLNLIAGSKEDVEYICNELNADQGNVSG